MKNAGTYIGGLLLALWWAGLGASVIPVARQHDFLNLYTGAELALGGRFAGLHDPAVQLAAERAHVPSLPVLVPFVRPAVYAAALAPLALAPFDQAIWYWIAFHSALLLACCIWASRRFGPDAFLLGFLFAPPAMGIVHGQDCVLLLALVCAAWEAHLRRRRILTGIFLGLCVVKFHLFLLVPAALLLRRAWRELAGYTASAGTLAAASLLLGGLEGARRYVALLTARDIERLSPNPEKMANIHALAGNLGVESTLLGVMLAIAVAVAGLLVARRADWSTALAATLAASALMVPHVYGYDLAVLAVPAWGLYRGSESLAVRAAAVLLLTPFPFLIGLAGQPWSAAPALAVTALLGAVVWAVLIRRPAATPSPAPRTVCDTAA
jgi:hypothetical protein